MCVDAQLLNDRKWFKGGETAALLLIIQTRKIEIQDEEKMGCIANLPWLM